jgi:hypothetical protein
LIGSCAKPDTIPDNLLLAFGLTSIGLISIADYATGADTGY